MKQIEVKTLYTQLPDGSWQQTTQIAFEGKTASPPPTTVTRTTFRATIRPLLAAAVIAERAIRDDARSKGQTAVAADKERSLVEVEGLRDTVDGL